MKKGSRITFLTGVFGILCVLALLLGGITAYASEADEFNTGYDSYYKVSVDDAAWKSFQTGDEMRRAVLLDEADLVDLSSEELLRAVLEYPLICDLYAYDSFEAGIKAVSINCTALRLFLQREDAKDVIKVSLDNTRGVISKLRTTDAQKELAPFVLYRLESYLIGDEADELGQTRAVVYTPRGTAVQVSQNSEMSQSEINYLNTSTINAYPQAQYVATATRKYNCHSYAWYWSSTSNPYWMNNPSSYMTDGSYSQVNTIMNAHKVYYPSGGHSANVYDAAGNSTANAKVISKWGQGPLMIHKVHYGPYSGSVTLWR